MDFPPRRKRRALWPHLLILTVAVLSIGAFGRAEDEINGKASVADACGFTLVFVVAGYFLGWLPAIWEKAEGTAAGAWVMPAFIGLVLLYVYLGFRSYFIQPGVTGVAVFAQIASMIVLSCRIG